jgi:putative hydrolase of the HAD superfamily
VSRWQAIIFDLDDTLYPERDYVLSGFRAVAAWAAVHLGIPHTHGYAELRNLFEQGVRGDTFDRWLTAHDRHAPALTARLVQVYRDHEPELVPFTGVPELLGTLGQRCRLGLLSDGYLGVQQAKLRSLGLAAAFDAVVFSDTWGRTAWKPSPIPFTAILEKLETEATRAVYVGDNPAKDFLGARRSGLSAIWLRQAGGEYAHQEPPTAEHAPDFTIPSLAALERLLEAPAGVQEGESSLV